MEDLDINRSLRKIERTFIADKNADLENCKIMKPQEIRRISQKLWRLFFWF